MVARLNDGRVLVVGGSVLQPGDPDLELYMTPPDMSSNDAASRLVDPEHCQPLK